MNVEILDYLVIGAGPAGVQMGYFLQKAGRKYQILEKQHTAGAFYTKFPLHRTMISFNKRFNFFEEPDFNMRHDWNSLLSDDPSLLLKNYTEELYPHADVFVKYVADFAAKSGLNVKYNTAVTQISKQADGSFLVTDSAGTTYQTRCLINATGAVAPNVPDDIEGIENATNYQDHSIDQKLYENKRVAIIGAGNTAFECANHLAGHAAIVHILTRRPIRHAWQTHFVGDLRSINNTILDMYQLKSLHATIGFRPTKIWKHKGKLKMLIEEDLPHWKNPGTNVTTVEYDHVIVCTGWKYVNSAMYDETCKPKVDEKGKYPQVNSEWESVNVKDLFFIGASMGSRDKKAASGFIHGFRYNVRTLFHLLETRYFGVAHPSKEFPLKTEQDLHEFAGFLTHRLSTVSALYQLNGFLTDLITFEKDKAIIHFELPMEHVMMDERVKSGKACTMSLEYGFKHYDPTLQAVNFIHPSDAADPNCSAFLHPIFRYYDRGEMKAEKHLGESLVIRYDHHDYEENVQDMARNAVKNHLNAIAKVTETTFSEEWYRPEDVGRGFIPWTEEKKRMMHDKLEQMERTQTLGGFRCKYANYR